MSLRRAVVAIQAPGLHGIPSVRQLTTAAAKASCMASSARSKECEIRIRPAIIRPDSVRKTDSTVERWSSIHRHTLGKLADGTDLNASSPTGTGSGYPGRPVESFVEILAVEDIVSGELLFGLGKWTVGDHRAAVVH